MTTFFKKQIVDQPLLSILTVLHYSFYHILHAKVPLHLIKAQTYSSIRSIKQTRGSSTFISE